MAKLFSIAQDKLVDVPEDRVQQSLLSGEFVLGNEDRIPVRLSDGRVGDVDFKNFKNLVKSRGASYLTTGARAKIEDEKLYGGAAGNASAFGLGVLSGASFGLSDQAIAAASPEAKKFASKVREVNPNFSTVGDITGAVGASLLVPGGAVVSGTRAAIGAGARAAVGRGAARAIMASKTARGTSALVNRALSSAAIGAAENTLFETGRALSENALQDTELSGEYLIGRLGTAAALGAGTGGLFTLTGAGLKASGRVAKAAAQKSGAGIKKLYENTIGEPLTDFAASALSTASGKDKDSIRKLLTNKRFRDMIGNKSEVVDKSARDLFDNIDDVFVKGPAREARFEAFGKAKIKQAAKKLPKDDASKAAIAETSVSKANQVADIMKKMSVEDAATPGSFGNRAVRKRIERRAQKLVKDVEGSVDDPTEMYTRLDDFRRDINAERRSIKALTAEDAAAAEEIDRAFKVVREHLEDEAVFGDMGLAQKEINRATSKLIEIEKKTNPFFRVDKTTGEIQMKQTSFEPIVRRINKLKGSQEISYLDEVADALQEQANTIRKHYTLSDQALGKVKGLEDTVKSLRSTIKTIKEDVVGLNQLDEMSKMDGRGYATEFLASTVGGISGGFTGAGIGATVGATLANPVASVQRLSAVANAVSGTAKSIDSAAKGFVRAATTGKTGQAVKTAGVLSSLSSVNYGRPNDRKQTGAKAAIKHAENLTELANNPDALWERLQRNLGELGVSAPNTVNSAQQTVARAVTYLASIAPKPPGDVNMFPYQRQLWQPSDTEVAKFARAISVAEDPAIVLKRMANGTATQVEFDALKNIYPRIFNEARLRVVEQIAKTNKPIPADKMSQLSLWFDLPMSKYQSMVAEFQAGYAATREPNNQQQPGGVTLTGLRAVERGQNQLTRAQTLEQGLPE